MTARVHTDHGGHEAAESTLPLRLVLVPVLIWKVMWLSVPFFWKWLFSLYTPDLARGGCITGWPVVIITAAYYAALLISGITTSCLHCIPVPMSWWTRTLLALETIVSISIVAFQSLLSGFKYADERWATCAGDHEPLLGSSFYLIGPLILVLLLADFYTVYRLLLAKQPSLHRDGKEQVPFSCVSIV